MNFVFAVAILCFALTSCKKSNDKPTSKTDYIPINSATTPRASIQGQAIRSRVNCGFYEHFADITFLNFEVNERNARQYEIKAKGFYDNIQYGTSLPVVSTFDTTLVIQAPSVGQYILKFYSFDELVQTDTVQVN
jgi:hypothetical protein